jgi:nicotinamidase-related amidase
MRLPKSTTLLLIDLQLASDDPKRSPRNNHGAESTTAGLLALWRERRMPIVHVRHEPAGPDPPGLAPLDAETVVAMEAGSAFIGTRLEAVLDDLGSTDLVACGALTNTSLEATVRHAGDLGYRVFVPSDACWAIDKLDRTGRLWPAEDVHQISLANLHGAYAEVTSAAAVHEALKKIRW